MRAAANARSSDLLAGAAGRPRWWWSAPSSRPPAARCRAGPAPRCRPLCPVPPNGVPERGCRAVVAVLDHSGGQALIFPAEGRADLLGLRQPDGEAVSLADLGGAAGTGGPGWRGRGPGSRLAGWVPGQTVQSAWVGDMRAARIAGRSPAAAPMRMAAPMPPPQARAGTTTAQPLVCA